MSHPHRDSRRRFIQHAAVGAGALVAAPHFLRLARGERPKRLQVASNVYPWITFARREGETFGADWDASLAAIRAADLDGFEPIVGDPAQLDVWAPLLEKHGLQMRSFYMNIPLHDASVAPEAIGRVLNIAVKAQQLGTKIVVINPEPLSWSGEGPGKSDPQLRIQAANLDRLGAGLRERGLTLAYHFHAPEMQHAAREFHHMMCGTEADHVSLCFDTHWVFRGADDSQIAVFDIAKLYASRIVELHLRQSRGGIWTETFSDGDIDYRRLATFLAERNIQPHIVLEQAVEGRSPDTMSAVDAHRAGARYTREVFAALA